MSHKEIYKIFHFKHKLYPADGYTSCPYNRDKPTFTISNVVIKKVIEENNDAYYNIA